MLILTHLYNRIKKLSFHIVLLLGGLFLYEDSFAAQKVVVEDKFVFKVAREVFSLNELKEYYQEVNNLKCIYPESILNRVFVNEFSLTQQKNYNYSKDLSSGQKDYFKKLIKFGKVLIYSRSHDVVINSSLNKYFYLTAKKQKCSLTSFDSTKSFQPRFREMVRLEIFLRSRFLPAESQGKATKEDVKKAVNAARNLIKSIDEQIEQEIYW